MSPQSSDSEDITSLGPEFGFWSEIGAAWTASRNGNPWPIAIFEAKAGKKERLATLIRNEGLPAGSEAAKAVADMLDGTFKPTKRDRSKMRDYDVLVMVSLFNMFRLLIAGDPVALAKEPRLKSLEDVYVASAEELGMTRDAVEKIVTRNRKRIRELGGAGQLVPPICPET
jgi:hypothetical protein